MTKRIAIVLLSDLERGEAANVAAVLCGQISQADSQYFNSSAVTSKDGLSHAAPNYSVVVLRAKNASQLESLASQNPEAICFSRYGQGLNNAFEQYARGLAEAEAKDVSLIGVAVYGDDESVRAKTKKFSLMS